MTLIDLTHDLIVRHCQEQGIPSDDSEGFVSHLSQMLEALPVEEALGDVDRSYFDSYMRDQAVESRVEALEL